MQVQFKGFARYNPTVGATRWPLRAW